MPDEHAGTARERFARDLRRIRKDREVSVTEIHRDTQISTAQIEALEAGRLFDQASMNEVYLRAFVRAYAIAIGIPTESVLNHLDRALDGTYENEAAIEWLGVPPGVTGEASPSSTESPTETTETDPPPDSERTRRPSEETTRREEESEWAKRPEADDPGTTETAPSDEPQVGEEEAETVKAAADRREWLEEDGNGETEGASAGPVENSGTSTDEVSVHSGSAETPRRSWTGRLWHEHRGEILVGVVALFVALGMFSSVFLISDGSTTSSDEETSSAAAAMESDGERGAQADTSEASVRRPPATVSLGDTMYVTVLAEGVVRRMRVRQDDDLRRPYWIEKGEATVFPFTRRIMIQDRLDSVRVYFERYRYPRTRTDDAGRIVIDRQTAQSILDTLRGTPVSLSVDPDTVDIRTPSLDEEGG